MDLSASDLKEILARKDDILLLDVRSKEECAEGIIAGSINIPVEQLKARAHELPKGKKVVVICAHGSRSMLATYFLKAQGFDAVNVRGGMTAFERLG